jgi:hypothetical protein
MVKKSLNVLLIVPTGVGAAIGGYAGDALPIARSLAAVADNLITHPNVLNGASFVLADAQCLVCGRIRLRSIGDR